MSGEIYVIGIGPGSLELITPQARAAIQQVDVLVGYKPYLDLIAPLMRDGQTREASGMTREVDRARHAVDIALAGQKVAVISSGDAGIYAMGSIVFEMLQEKGWSSESQVQVQMLPGITAAISCASLVGTPLGHDNCTISLSDLLTPWSIIEKRIEAAAAADFAITFYNPRSKRRTQQIEMAQQILLKHRAADTPVAIIDNAYREEQRIELSTLGEFTGCEFAMTAAVIVGNSQSYRFDNYTVTPRGYRNKYELETGEVKEGQRRGRTLQVAG